MSKLLTQEEIDALLSSDQALETGEPEVPEEKELRLYDFKRPDRISRDQSKTLRNIHDNFAKLLSTYLSNILRTMVDVKSPTIEQISYLEFTMSASDFTNMYQFEIEGLEGKAILEVDPNFTFFLVDRLFGGPGSTNRKRDSITEIESYVLRNVADKILGYFQESWANIDTLVPKIHQFETNPQLVTIAPSSETMIVISFPILTRNFEFSMLLCFPYFMLEPVLKKLLDQTFMSLLKKKPSESDLEIIHNSIEQTNVDFVIELGRTELLVQDFVNLNLGDILTLDRKTDEYLIANIKDIPKFLGIPGKQDNKLVFKIQHILDEQGEIINGNSRES